MSINQLVNNIMPLNCQLLKHYKKRKKKEGKEVLNFITLFSPLLNFVQALAFPNYEHSLIQSRFCHSFFKCSN